MNKSVLTAAALLLPLIAQAGYRVSSARKANKMSETYWDAAAAIDGKVSTAWKVDSEQENVGQWFEVDMPKATIDKLSVVVGWAKDETTFKDYPRIKELTVEIFDEAGGTEKKVLEHTLLFKDVMSAQVLDLPDTSVGDDMNKGRIRMTVKSVYPGEDYPALAVSEILVVLKEQEGTTLLRELPKSIDEGKAAEHMVDGNLRTYWASASAGEQEFTVEAPDWGESGIAIAAGPKPYARPKTVQLTVNSQVKTVTLADKSGLQWFELPAIVGYTGSAWGEVTVKVLDTYAGTKPGVAISEVGLKVTNYDG